jgi:dipeptide/tripeptide permease
VITESRTRLARAAEAVPAGPARLLAAVSAVDAVGSGAFLTASATFYVAHMRVAPGLVGIGLSLAGAAGLCSGMWLGRLSDRWGARRTLILLNLVLAVLFCALSATTGFWGFLVMVAAITTAQSGVNPARSSLTYHALDPEARVRLQAVQRSLFNLGFAAGTGLAGLALQLGSSTGFRLLILCNVLSYLVGALLVWRVPTPGRADGRSTSGGVVRDALSDRPFLAFVGLSTVLLLSESIFYVGFPLWIVSVAAAPRWTAAAAFLLNTALVVLFQVRLSRGADRPGASARLMRRALGALAAAGIVMAACGSLRGTAAVAPLLLAAVLVTLAEMRNSTVAWTVLFAHAPADRQGFYQGVYGLGVSAQMLIGPVLVGSVLIPFKGLGWLVVGATALALLPLPSLLVARLRSGGGAADPAADEVTAPDA